MLTENDPQMDSNTLKNSSILNRSLYIIKHGLYMTMATGTK